MQAEGLGQLFVRLLTANFEEAVVARVEGRPPVFTDERGERSRGESAGTDDT
jgi:enoyl-CoA hydratase